MNLKCVLGMHEWKGCKCTNCGKTRDEGHDWATDCENCARCGKSRADSHQWSTDCEKCAKCGKTRAGAHSWSGCKCSKCGKTRDEGHDWGQDCEKCHKCGAKRANVHKWDGCKCTVCRQIRENGHSWDASSKKCSRCGQRKPISFEDVLAGLQRAIDEKDEKRRAAICIELADYGTLCSSHIKTILTDKSKEMPLRRFAMGVGAGCHDPSYNAFIKSHFIDGINKSEMLRKYYAGNTDGSEVALNTASEEILNTPDYFERYVAK